MRRKIQIWFFVSLFLLLPLQAKQSLVLEKIAAQVERCGPNYFFETANPSSDSIFKMSGGTFRLSEAKAKQLNLFPVNNCVLRGNRLFYQEANARIADRLNIYTLLRLGALHYSTHKFFGMKVISLPMKVYRKVDVHEMQTLAQALDVLASAKPDSRVLVSCYYGKHRTGLLVAMYQFAYEYVQDSQAVCKNYSAQNDRIYLQMNRIAEAGLLTYDQPDKFRVLYLSFRKALCEGNSEEFFKADAKETR